MSDIQTNNTRALISCKNLIPSMLNIHTPKLQTFEDGSCEIRGGGRTYNWDR